MLEVARIAGTASPDVDGQAKVVEEAKKMLAIAAGGLGMSQAGYESWLQEFGRDPESKHRVALQQIEESVQGEWPHEKAPGNAEPKNFFSYFAKPLTQNPRAASFGHPATLMLGKEPSPMSGRRTALTIVNGRASRSAEKYAMYTHPIVLRHESAEAFETLRRGYHAGFAPADRMAAAACRLRRLDNLTANASEQAQANPGSKASAQSRIYIRTFRKLRLCQSAARRNGKNPENEPEFSAFRRAA